jgi:hypothetical protein
MPRDIRGLQRAARRDLPAAAAILYMPSALAWYGRSLALAVADPTEAERRSSHS